MSVVLRDIVPDDTETLVALWIAAWTPTLPQIDFVARQGFIRERLRDYTHPPKRARVIEDGADIAGFMLLDPTIGDLEQIAVSPNSWGKIIAHALLSEAKTLCPAGLSLTVNRDNPRAVAFYNKQGFQITGESTSPHSGLPILHMAWKPA